MTIRSIAASLVLFSAILLPLSIPGRASAGIHDHCQKTVFYKPKKPHVHYKNICPKPICPCGELENFGYFPTCWTPWPYPPNYAHCPGPMPPQVPIPAPKTSSSDSTSEQLPAPEQLPSESSQPKNVPADKKSPDNIPSEKKPPKDLPSDKTPPKDVPSDKKPPTTSPSPG